MDDELAQFAAEISALTGGQEAEGSSGTAAPASTGPPALAAAGAATTSGSGEGTNGAASAAQVALPDMSAIEAKLAQLEKETKRSAGGGEVVAAAEPVPVSTRFVTYPPASDRGYGGTGAYGASRDAFGGAQNGAASAPQGAEPARPAYLPKMDANNGPQPGTQDYQRQFMRSKASSDEVPAATLSGQTTAAAAGPPPPSDKPLKTVRAAGGKVWEDNTLADWPDNDFRLFVGNLGPEANDKVLFQTFQQYNSLQRARVVKDRWTNRDRGYGFLSFGDPYDCIRAMREMDGKFCGGRPIQVRKSTYKDRAVAQSDKKLKSQGNKKLYIKRKSKKHLF